MSRSLRSYHEWQIGYDDAVQGRQHQWYYLGNAAYTEGYKEGSMMALPSYRRRFSMWPFL